MSFDARDMLEVNRQLILEAGEGVSEEPFVVVSVATWGRGARPEVLRALEPYRQGLGFNGSVVARIPRSVADQLFELPEESGPPPQGARFRAVGVVFRETYADWF